MAITLPDARQLSDEVLEALRLRAVRGCELGFTKVDVADLLGLSRETEVFTPPSHKLATTGILLPSGSCDETSKVAVIDVGWQPTAAGPSAGGESCGLFGWH